MAEELQILKDVALAPLTTLKIGGAARFFVRAASPEHAVDAFRYSVQNSLRLFVLGGGSNVLISDAGFDGLVLQIAIPGISEKKAENGVMQLTVGAGVDWDQFVEHCVVRELQGIECLSGIPGFVGGTPIQNVGAYGQEVSETILSVQCFDRLTERLVELDNSACGFSYRKSIFNTSEKDRYIVLAVTYALRIDSAPRIVYADLKSHFGTHRPTLAETRNAVLKIRAAKSMVIDADDINSRSAGSFFKNPVVSREEFQKVDARARKLKIISEGDTLPCFRIDDTKVKIPAAWLIEKAGFCKGFRLGDAGISEKHALALVNRGHATASEILKLKGEIEEKVAAKFGVTLQPEPSFIGF